MTRKTTISIDAYLPDGGFLIPDLEYAAILNGCYGILSHLGPLGEMVVTIHVTWVKLDALPGPRFTIFFTDPLGNTCSHAADHHAIGSGKIHPTSDEIW